MSDTITRSALPGEPIRGREDSRRQFCVECGLSFGIVDRSDWPSTCCDCAARMPPSAPYECEDCQRMFVPRHDQASIRLLIGRLCPSCWDSWFHEGLDDDDAEDW